MTRLLTEIDQIIKEQQNRSSHYTTPADLKLLSSIYDELIEIKVLLRVVIEARLAAGGDKEPK